VTILLHIAQSYKEVVFEEEPKVFLSIFFITKLTMNIPKNRALNGNMYVESVQNLRLTCNKVIRKVKKRPHWNTLFGHIGDEISKNEKQNTWDFKEA
jgi:hypothetical protein